ncbi:uncharacterized protein E0L32_004279 [Thyridium curvatum]|uniref:Uncharacterized protein n=1 Tax=Thyridium curvatum TaxID=1093900 RepID=A0A507BF49_9PEZI|nr:uncharacterized protein E0L32_004279 [Thyridium curvatum]TPX15581.1 hypothetical protein E0L32_004279 [Thyridium curvatum]
MPSASAGRIVKSTRNKKTTPHQKNHRWESFSAKVSKLHSLDPLRRVRRHDLDAETLDTATSYLGNGLEKWTDLNISRDFTSFRREILPLCESLPQILHFEDKIMDILATYISREEKESLEALLDLLTAFAHDLGVRFEKHYPRALELITTIASKPQPVEVIEWTFAALAFLFKYLARLLVPDLRPTYDALAPLLGKERQPGHIARFAAEALSFLIKKAAAPANKEKALPQIVQHARDDLKSTVGTKQHSLYYHGLMTMFAEAIKSSGNTVHSTGPDIFTCLLRCVPDDELVPGGAAIWIDLCCGVLTSIIHHSTPETFDTMADAIVAEATAWVSDPSSTENPWRLSVLTRIFGVAAGVRRGNRISAWPAFIQAFSKVIDSLSKSADKVSQYDASQIWQHILVNTAVVWNQAAMDALIPHISQLMNAMTREPLMRWYIPFCAYFAELDSGRFRTLFQKHFQRFVVAHWSDDDNEQVICILLPRMVANGGLPSVGDKEAFPLPQSWQDQIVSKFERLEITPFPERGTYDKDPKTWRDKCLPMYSSLLEILECTSVHPSTNARIAELLLKKLKLALRPSTSEATEEVIFILTRGFRAYLRMTKIVGSLDSSLRPLLRAAAPRFARFAEFLEALHLYEQTLGPKVPVDGNSSNGSESPQPEEDHFVKALVGNLAAPSHRLRLVSLQLLQSLDVTPDQLSVLAIMTQTEETPLNLQSTRTISAHLRKLGQLYGHLEGSTWLVQAVPSFLFGMMTVPLSPVWDDAVQAMKQVAESKSGEEAIPALAFEWLEVASPRWSGPQRQPTEATHQPLTDFECLNYNRLQSLSSETTKVIRESSEIMREAFENSQEVVPLHAHNARSKALKVLQALPGLAEKRSRKLVPHLFSWNEDKHVLAEGDDGEEQEESSADAGWSLADRKALVGVFAQFVNPRVLYQHEKVYDIMLKLMANGDIEIQKLALKAILAWKQEGLKPYRENLEYLLDEARFKNELTVLFQGDHRIQPEHRADLMPVLLRLLYGRTISKKGAASGRHGLQATRLAVIRILDVEDVGAFLQIALGELQGVQVVNSSGVEESTFSREVIAVRKQVGLLNMLESIINELGTAVEPYMAALVHAILYCLISACRVLYAVQDEESEFEDEKSNVSLNRVVRTTSLKCLCSLFRNAPGFDWTAYENVLVSEIISPTIEKLPVETTQSVSWTWRLLSTWSQLPKAALFLSIDERIVPTIISSLSVEKSKDEIKIFALSIVRNLVQLGEAPASESEFNELIKSELLVPHIDLLLKSIGGLLRDKPDMGRNLLEAAVETVVEVAPLVEESEHVKNLVEISAFLLNQPSRRVNPKVKGSILLILERFIQLEDLQSDADLKQKVYKTLSSLFSFFKDRQNRQSLVRALLVFASQDESVEAVAKYCDDLNSYKERGLDQLDYDRRLSAYNAIAQAGTDAFTINQWLPILHNMVFYIKQDEEFGVLSSNSADVICKFIDAVAAKQGGADEESFVAVLTDVIMPTIYAGSREDSETVRREVIRVLGFLVSAMPSWAPVADLAPLAVSEEQDSERAFFFHILSPAVSRQLQALQLLEGVNAKTEFSSKNISQFFIPLLEHFIFGREDGADDHGLGAQASNTIAALSASLEWAQYRALLRRFISFVESKPDLQKQVIRLLDRTTDALARATAQKSADSMEVDQPSEVDATVCRLAKTLPGTSKLSDELVNNQLPTLIGHLHEKDEATVSARVPVGVIVVKLLNILPDEVRDQKLAGVLTDICHILRSKAWESREMARDTLAKISSILGPSCFGFILTELRGALTRGSQLHILSYSMHTLLLVAIPQFGQGDLDYCLPSIVAIIMDDIFGVTGQEKDAEDYNSKMKEVKSSKSQDSMELIAKNASVSHLVELVQPLQAMLLEKLDIRLARKIDELLNRIASGLLQNPAAESRDTLVFCYEVIQDVYRSQKPKEEPKMDPRVKRYLIQKGAKKTSERGMSTKYTHKLVRFALDVLRSILRKHDSLRNAGNISGFLPILGDAVIAGEEEVKIAAFKLLTVLVKVPFKTDESTSLYKVALKEALKAISQSTTTSSDLPQSALKLVSVVLRDRREIPVKDAAVDMLLSKLKDDLTEPLYRHVTFNFLRSVLDRRIETASVYDTLDYVGTVMITNDDKETRNLARGAFFQFLRDYPQKKSRWQKQLAFVVANLKYDREGGRLSVMEVVHLLLQKSADEFTQEVISTCFIPLIFVLANDDSEKCRLVAAELLKEIFRRSSKENTQNFLKLLRSWIDQDEKPAVMTLALHAFGLYFDAKEPENKDKKDLNLVLGKIAGVVEGGAADDADLVNVALQTVQVLVVKHPSRVLGTDSEQLWEQIRSSLSSTDNAVRLTAMKLVGSYLADFASNEGGTKGSHGLELGNDEVSQLVRLMLRILGTQELEDSLAEEVVRTLIFLGRYLATPTETSEADAEEEEAEDVEEEEEGDEAESEGNEPEEEDRQLGLGYLFNRLAAIIRKETPPKATALVSKLSAMHVLEVFCSTTPRAGLDARSMRRVLRPLRNLTDPTIPAPFSTEELFRTRHEELKAKAHAVMEVLQKKLGTADYTRHLLAAGEEAKGRREQRAGKRKIYAVTNPERAGRDKRKRFEKKRERRKVKGQEHRSMRRGY